MSEQEDNFEIGIVLPNYGSRASAEGIARVAGAAEELGFDSVWVTEHLLVAREFADPYGTVLEPLSCLAWLAGRLKRVKLGTSVEVADRIGQLARAGAHGVVLGVGFDPEAAVHTLRAVRT